MQQRQTQSNSYPKGKPMMTSQRPDKVIRADHIPGPRQGEWTYSHYEALPDDGQKYEIINGVLYMSPMPNWFHQGIANLIGTYLTMYVQFTGLGQVYDPSDVELEFNAGDEGCRPDPADGGLRVL